MIRLLLAMIVLASSVQAEVATLRVGIQPGMAYLALYQMQREALAERRAAAEGIALKVEWIVSANGTVLNDGLLSGNIDVVGTGIPPFVILWAKGKGSVDIKGIAGYGALPLVLVSRNPLVKTPADFTSADRIALPAPKASIQAIMLSMMAEKIFGPGQHGKLDALTVGLSHPDAMIALLSGRSEINAHFTSAPYYQEELKHPGMHVVMVKEDVFPGPLTHGMLYTTTKFRNENPKALRAFRGGLDDAMALIHNDHRRAAENYLALAREKVDVAELEAMVGELHARFTTTPHGVFQIASFLNRTGTIKTAPAAWTDMFFEEFRDPDGS